MVLVTCIKIKSRPAGYKNVPPYVSRQFCFIEPPKNKIMSLFASLLQGKLKKIEYDCLKPNFLNFFKRYIMHYLMGSIVKHAEILNKNVFTQFFQVVLGSKSYLGGLQYRNRKSKKNINGFFKQKKLGRYIFVPCWSRQGLCEILSIRVLVILKARNY